ncbi:MAG: glycosyltransferase family 2 protein [Chitinispirillaceae bacterium]|nr:glycosyltransferase family 2 protein [Chitinispirillaceae bacterium]
MLNNKRVVVVLPAYNAESTLEQTYAEIPRSIVDAVILVDDASHDKTFELAKNIGLTTVIKHDRNRGYGGNQKTCYDAALSQGADIVIMLHPDYQYTPLLIPAMAHMIASGLYHAVFGSRILGKGAIKGGMPRYKYIANRFLTLAQNALMGQKLSEYHTGYRAFSAEVLRKINYASNSDDFVFDNEMTAQIFYAGYEIAEVTCPTRYFSEASSINFLRSVVYGFGVLRVSLQYALQKAGFARFKLFRPPDTAPRSDF